MHFATTPYDVVVKCSLPPVVLCCVELDVGKSPSSSPYSPLDLHFMLFAPASSFVFRLGAHQRSSERLSHDKTIHFEFRNTCEFLISCSFSHYRVEYLSSVLSGFASFFHPLVVASSVSSNDLAIVSFLAI